MRNFRAEAEDSIEAESRQPFNRSHTLRIHTDGENQQVVVDVANNRDGRVNTIYRYTIPAIEYADDRMTTRKIQDEASGIHEEIRVRSIAKSAPETMAFMIPESDQRQAEIMSASGIAPESEQLALWKKPYVQVTAAVVTVSAIGVVAAYFMGWI